MKEAIQTKPTNEIARTEVKPMTAATPFGFMRRFATEMEQLFQDFEGFRFPSVFGREFFPFTRELERVAWTPQVEVLQTNGDFKVTVDLPGLKQEDIKVEVTKDFLTISGERKEEKEEKREGFYRTERSYGSFYRQIPLPEGAKTDTATAKFVNGVLEVKLAAPKTEPQVRRLEIKDEVTTKAKAAAV